MQKTALKKNQWNLSEMNSFHLMIKVVMIIKGCVFANVEESSILEIKEKSEGQNMS